MGDSTHTLTASGFSNQDTMRVHVPAQVQREQGISIDDELEVAILGVSSLIDRASFETRQMAGDQATIPAHIARELGLVAGEEYEFEFEKLTDEEELPGSIPDEDVTTDEDVAEAIEEAEEAVEQAEESVEELPEFEELMSEEDEDESEDEPGIGELFG